ncbi:hypothetical protein AOQ84DRAFT_313889 [Glonium stellatum]|uniref:LITAF domain-containing protein n=1 Tax=Glonium stellatum TaxID=574774 RepID=A0A8E2JW66_9PEZI|nr:hypothetical protein AOQ84DRAFT_313889 [Glonium stellatum]
MGAPAAPRESAPAYEELFNDHPVNQHPPSGSSTAYATVPQVDDSEFDHSHHHSAPPLTPTSSETPLRTLGGTPHVHCEACDIQIERREKRHNEQVCCALVAATFMVAFVCLMLLGIVVANSRAAKSRH